MKTFILFVLIVPCFAESRWHKVFVWSQAALVAGNTMDAVTTAFPHHGTVEQNPLLRQGGISLKLGIVGGVLIAEHLLERRHKAIDTQLSIVNFGIGAGMAGVAVHNWRLP